MKLIYAILITLSFSLQVNANEQSSMEQWLALVDNGRFAESWESAAPLFKSQVTSAQWQQAVVNARKPFGELLSRELIKGEKLNSLPNLPEGEYFIAQFNAEYQHKSDVIETVTLMKTGDEWQVAGYFLR